MNRVFWAPALVCVFVSLSQLSFGQEVEIDEVATSLNPNGQRNIYPYALHNFAFSNDGSHVVAGNGSGEVWIINLDEHASSTFQGHEDWAFSTRFIDDSTGILTGGGDNLVREWDLDDLANPKREFSGHTGDVHAVVLSPDGEFIASAGDDGIIFIWDRENEVMRQRLTGHEKQIPTIDVSPNGELLASGSRDTTVRVWDIERGEQVKSFDGHTMDVLRVCFSHNGQWIASGSYDQTARVWDVDMGSELVVQDGHVGAVVSVAISPDDQWLASVDHQQLVLTPMPQVNGVPTTFRLVDGSSEQLSFVEFHPNGTDIAVTTTLGRLLVLDRQQSRIKQSFETAGVTESE